MSFQGHIIKLNNSIARKRKIPTTILRSTTTNNSSSPLQTDIPSISSNLISGSLTFDLSKILAKIKKTLVDISKKNTSSSCFELKNYNGHWISIKLPCILDESVISLFDVNNFYKNFYIAFDNVEMEKCKVNFLRFESQINVTIRVDIPKTIINDNINKTFNSQDHLRTFRLLTCLLLAFLFNIKLSNSCECFPISESDFGLYTIGLGMNCLKNECRQYLYDHPTMYDLLLHSPECTTSFGNINVFNNSIISNMVGSNIRATIDIEDIRNNILLSSKARQKNFAI